MIDGALNILILLVVLVALVLVHELGHFITAKRAGAADAGTRGRPQSYAAVVSINQVKFPD